MNTSTMQNVTERLAILKEIADKLATRGLPKGEEDIWETEVVDDMEFDFNIFLWENDNGKETLNVTVHPVTMDADSYGSADMSNFLRLVTEEVN